MDQGQKRAVIMLYKPKIYMEIRPKYWLEFLPNCYWHSCRAYSI